VSFLISVIILFAGFVLLIKGADWLVEGASSLARVMGMSDLMIGLTIVAFGTSMPELLVNVIASAQGNTDIAIGNIVGSNIANTFLVLGLAAMIAPLAVQTSTVWNEIPLSALAGVALAVMVGDVLLDESMYTSVISRSEGMILLLFFFIFLYYTFGLKRGNHEEHSGKAMNTFLAIGYILAGILILPLGGKLVVDSASVLALLFGLSEALIGLSLVALGTSLPEVITACLAVYRGKTDIAVGNVVGSNIFNIFWILGVSAIIRPLAFNSVLFVDILVLMCSSVLLFYLVHNGSIHKRVFSFWRQRNEHAIVKSEGILLLVCYTAYIVYIGWRG
jgi:cation:H+ antiporter